MGRGKDSEKRVVVGAFDASKVSAVQRSHLILEHLIRAKQANRGLPKGWTLDTKVFPSAPTSLKRSLDRVLTQNPEIVLLLGETHADELRLEQIALNRYPAEAKANAKTLVTGAPLAYFSPHPLEKARKAAARSGIQFKVSTYPHPSLANAALYTMLHRTYGRREGSPLVALLQVPIRSRVVSLQDATRAAQTLLRYLAGASAARSVRATPHAKDQDPTPAAGRKA